MMDYRHDCFSVWSHKSNSDIVIMPKRLSKQEQPVRNNPKRVKKEKVDDIEIPLVSGNNEVSKQTQSTTSASRTTSSVIMRRRQTKQKNLPSNNPKLVEKEEVYDIETPLVRSNNEVSQDMEPDTLASRTTSSVITAASSEPITLESIGLKYAPKEMSSNILGERASFLRATYCTSANDFTIVFRCQPITAGYNWPERVIKKAIRDVKPWAGPNGLSFDKHHGIWYDNDIEQVNVHPKKEQRPYGVCVFYIHLKKKPTEKQIRKVGQIICNAVTTTQFNTSPLLYDEPSFIWLKQPVVWADVVGSKAAYDMMVKELGTPAPGGKPEMLLSSVYEVDILRLHILSLTANCCFFSIGFCKGKQKLMENYFDSKRHDSYIRSKLLIPEKEICFSSFAEGFHPSDLSSGRKIEFVTDKKCGGKTVGSVPRKEKSTKSRRSIGNTVSSPQTSSDIQSVPEKDGKSYSSKKASAKKASACRKPPTREKKQKRSLSESKKEDLESEDDMNFGSLFDSDDDCTEEEE